MEFDEGYLYDRDTILNNLKRLNFRDREYLRRTIGGLAQDAAPITEPVTYTVGVGQDFELFHDAMLWATRQTTLDKGVITLSLSDGIHYVGGPDMFNQHSWAYYKIDHQIIVRGSAKENCTITMPPDDDGDMYPTVFMTSGGYFILRDITVDTALGGYPYAGNVSVAYSSNCYTKVERCVFKNTDMGFYTGYGGTGVVKDSILDNCAMGVETAGTNTSIHVRDTTIQNCAVGVNNSGAGSMIKLQNVTFINNTSDTSMPVNEIQYNGGYITNSTGALSFKA